MVLLPALGCAEAPPSACAAGYEERADGACHRAPDHEPTSPDPVEPAPPPEGLLAELPPCTATAGTAAGDLDLDTACLGRACLVMTYDQLRAELGRPDCFEFVFTYGGIDQGYVYCDFLGGIEASFYDLDLDGAPDGAPYDLGVTVPYDGTTDEGYGLGSEWSCFLQREAPLQASFVEDGAGLVLASLTFARFVVEDQANLYEDVVPDGLVDRITFRAP